MKKEPIKDTSYFSVQAWMVTKLNLKGVERDVYAIIYGYSQDNDSDFHGSLDFISQLTGYSRNSICTALKSLTEKGLISKTEKIVNNVKYCRYRTSYLYTVQATCTVNEESVQATCTNNKQLLISKDINSNIENKKEDKVTKEDLDWFINSYNEICVSLPKVRSITEKRKKDIKHILKKYSDDDILDVFELTEQSDFLTGHNDRGWKADIDFILREDKFVSILEGKYGGKKKSQKRFKNEGVSEKYTDEELKEQEEWLKEMEKRGEQTKY